MRRPERGAGARAKQGRWARRGAAGLVAATGIVLLVLATAWRGVEATLSAHAIQAITGQTTQADPARHLLILYKNTSVQSIFVLTSECSAAYLMATLLLGAAPLLLLGKLSPRRTLTAIAVALLMLTLVNVARLTAIGATVSELGRNPGMTIAHTYLGSVLTVVGTCTAGVAFAAILFGWPARRRLTAGTSD